MIHSATLVPNARLGTFSTCPAQSKSKRTDYCVMLARAAVAAPLQVELFFRGFKRQQGHSNTSTESSEAPGLHMKPGSLHMKPSSEPLFFDVRVWAIMKLVEKTMVRNLLKIERKCIKRSWKITTVRGHAHNFDQDRSNSLQK